VYHQPEKVTMGHHPDGQDPSALKSLDSRPTSPKEEHRPRFTSGHVKNNWPVTLSLQKHNNSGFLWKDFQCFTNHDGHSSYSSM